MADDSIRELAQRRQERDQARYEETVEHAYAMDERHDDLQERLVADPVYRRLLFLATSQVCGETRCQTCRTHSDALEALYKRREELLESEDG